MVAIVVFFVIFFAIRLYFLGISIKHEKALIKKGATQVGERHSKLLAAAHIVYYFSALASAVVAGVQFDVISAVGAAMVSASLLVLWFIIKALGEIWTVKVYILPNHTINRSWLFRTFKHPNYFLNIIPELIGIALLCRAWWVLFIGLPIYGVLLFIRIQQEELAMKHLF
ncbi:isoprenylcysteine carboxyl methyltransferase family protein [Moraxella ovis]|uniref:isoprenylcysteine carboxyl methyltransferase family protein n=1 Tax=Moraxella ovis TaxID=29433 RepID=UPI000D956E2B|nr:isoprenylcysteine carboxyl methyltransferase family protein [Moraxella ovis]SPX85737.1 Isoprenylcysteine carboxyl methyltransferase (ICMT) family [Moraxella ovis]STZ05462.1 Isoprenylcysteine carboxyl methyltransferase (ICMT) family [Moraxella ovis]